MKVSGPEIISLLRAKLPFGSGRHLYGVLGSYAGLSDFEHVVLAQARDPDGKPFSPPVNLNRELLARIGDDDLRRLIRDEKRLFLQVVRNQLNQELDGLLATLLEPNCLLSLKNLELIFAYQLDVGLFRARATDQHHILLLLPAQRFGDHVTLFHEAAPRFQRDMPGHLIADNHLWELKDE